MRASAFRGHQPELARWSDGRWIVRCRQCEARRDQSPPIGIGLPIASRIEAEAIARNHGIRAA